MARLCQVINREVRIGRSWRTLSLPLQRTASQMFRIAVDVRDDDRIYPQVS
jgi:hypothetical protein